MKGRIAALLLPALLSCAQREETRLVRDARGRPRAEVHFAGGRKEGPFRFFNPDGSVQLAGHYRNDSRNGTWISFAPNGDTLSVARFSHGRKDGLQAYWAPNGQLLRLEQFRSGKPDGFLYRFFADGSPRQITWYKQGTPDGPYLEWYKVDSTSVALTCGQFRGGKRTGRWTWFYGNGRPSKQGHYRDGVPAGRWRTWNARGALTGSTVRGAR